MVGPAYYLIAMAATGRHNSRDAFDLEQGHGHVPTAMDRQRAERIADMDAVSRVGWDADEAQIYARLSFLEPLEVAQEVFRAVKQMGTDGDAKLSPETVDMDGYRLVFDVEYGGNRNV